VRDPFTLQPPGGRMNAELTKLEATLAALWERVGLLEIGHE
jgi:hypothetical protein